MDWTFNFSRQADKFLAQHRLSDASIIEIVQRALQRINGEAVAVDLKHLHEPWKGFLRVRVQKVRIVFSFDAHMRSAYIAIVDFRDSAYRRKK